MALTDAKPQFEMLVSILAKNAHGVEKFKEVKSMIQGFVNTDARVQFLSPYLTKDIVAWEAVKDEIWPDEQTRNINKFVYLQGDVVTTSMPLA